MTGIWRDVSFIDTEKYEGLIDAEGYIDYDGLDRLLAEVKRLRERVATLESLMEYMADEEKVSA